MEVILSVLLFTDALEIRDAPRRSRTPVLRVLFLALPLSLLAVFFAVMHLLPDVRLPLCLVLACILVPSDLAPTASLLKDRRIPARLRSRLSVESGYNDGIVAPVFLFDLAMLGQGEHANHPLKALQDLVPALAVALTVGRAVPVLPVIGRAFARREPAVPRPCVRRTSGRGPWDEPTRVGMLRWSVGQCR